MLKLDELVNVLRGVVKELRIKYSLDISVDKIEEHKTKYMIYIVVGKTRVKIIVDKFKGRVRVYSGLTSLDLSVKKAFKRYYERIKGLRDGEKPV